MENLKRILNFFLIPIGILVFFIVVIIGYFIVREQLDRREVSVLIEEVPNVELLDIWGDSDVGVGVKLKFLKGKTITLEGVSPGSVITGGRILVHKVGDYHAQNWWCVKEANGWVWGALTPNLIETHKDGCELSTSNSFGAHKTNGFHGKLSTPIKSVADLSRRNLELEKTFMAYPTCPEFIQTELEGERYHLKGGEAVARSCIFRGDKLIYQGKDWKTKQQQLCLPK